MVQIVICVQRPPAHQDVSMSLEECSLAADPSREEPAI
jgi:hypothetical protein